MANDDFAAKTAAWRTPAIVYLLGVALNYPWELAQSFLYTAASHDGNLWLHCFLASLADGLIVLLLFGSGWLATGRRDWFVRPRVRDYAALLALGVSLAMLVEWIAVHVMHRWTYAGAMPRIPGLEIGLVPVLQMALLPPLIFRMAALVVARAARGVQR